MGPQLEVEPGSEARTYRILGELDMASAGQLIDALEPETEENGDLLLDLSGLNFIDSMGIQVLINLSTALDGRGCLILSSPSPAVARVFQLVRVGTFPNIHLQNGTPDDRPAS